MTDREEPLADEGAEAGEERHEGLIDRIRGSGVGTEDPNIVGDVGSTDVPPGRDPEGDLVVEEPLGAEVPPTEEAGPET